MLDFAVLVERKVVAVRGDLLLGNEETLGFAVGVALRVPRMVSPDHLGNVVLLDRLRLLVKRIADGLHVVEPHVVRAAVVRLREDEDRRRHARVGMEDTARQVDDCIQLLVLDKLKKKRRMSD